MKKSIYYLIHGILLFPIILFAQSPNILWDRTVRPDTFNLIADTSHLKYLSGIKIIGTSDKGCLIIPESNFPVPTMLKFTKNGEADWFIQRPNFNHDTISKVRINFSPTNLLLRETDSAYRMNSFQTKNIPYYPIYNLMETFVLKTNTSAGGEFITSMDSLNSIPYASCITMLREGIYIGMCNLYYDTVVRPVIYKLTGSSKVLLKQQLPDITESRDFYTQSIEKISTNKLAIGFFKLNYDSKHSNSGFVIQIVDTFFNLFNKFYISPRTLGNDTATILGVKLIASDNGIYVIGNLALSSSVRFPFVALFSEDGNLITYKVCPDTNWISSGFYKKGYGFVLAGQSKPKSPRTDSDFYTVVFSEDLTKYYSYTWGDTLWNYLNDVSFGSDNNYFVTGKFYINMYEAKLYVANIQLPNLSDIKENDKINDLKFSIYPQPLEQTGQISVSTQTPKYVTLKILDYLGRNIKNIYSGELQAGSYKYPIDGLLMPTGFYCLYLQSGNTNKSIPFMVLK